MAADAADAVYLVVHAAADAGAEVRRGVRLIGRARFAGRGQEASRSLREPLLDEILMQRLAVHRVDALLRLASRDDVNGICGGKKLIRNQGLGDGVSGIDIVETGRALPLRIHGVVDVPTLDR